MGIIINNKFIDQKYSRYDYVIDSKLGSSDTTWYRLYNSGWLEQGGISGVSSGVKPVIFPIPYYYEPLVYTTPQSEGFLSSDGNSKNYCGVNTITKTGFNIVKTNTSVRWFAVGYTNLTVDEIKTIMETYDGSIY